MCRGDVLRWDEKCILCESVDPNVRRNMFHTISVLSAATAERLAIDFQHKGARTQQVQPCCGSECIILYLKPNLCCIPESTENKSS